MFTRQRLWISLVAVSCFSMHFAGAGTNTTPCTDMPVALNAIGYQLSFEIDPAPDKKTLNSLPSELIIGGRKEQGREIVFNDRHQIDLTSLANNTFSLWGMEFYADLLADSSRASHLIKLLRFNNESPVSCKNIQKNYNPIHC